MLNDEVMIASAVSAMPMPPTDWAYSTEWLEARGRLMMDLRLWADAACNVTSGLLVGAEFRDMTLANDAVDTVDFANNELDLTGHAFSNGDGPVQLTTTGTLPSGLALATDYWIEVIDANAIRLHLTRDNLFPTPGGSEVPFTDVGSGVHTVEPQSGFQRLKWLVLEQLGVDDDGAVTLDGDLSYVYRFEHRREIIAYAVYASLSAAASASIKPVRGVSNRSFVPTV